MSGRLFLSPVVDSAGSNLAPVVVGRPGDRVVLDYQAWDPASLSTCGVDGADRLGSVGRKLTEVRVLRQDHEGHLPTLADEQVLGLVVGQVEVRNVDVRALGRLGVAWLEAGQEGFHGPLQLPGVVDLRRPGCHVLHYFPALHASRTGRSQLTTS